VQSTIGVAVDAVRAAAVFPRAALHLLDSNNAQWAVDSVALTRYRSRARGYAALTEAAAAAAAARARSVRQLAVQQQQVGGLPAVAAELLRCADDTDAVARSVMELAQAARYLLQIVQAATDPLLQLPGVPVELEQLRGRFNVQLRAIRFYPADLAAAEVMRSVRQRILSLGEPVSAIAVPGMAALDGAIVARLAVLHNTSPGSDLIDHPSLALEALQQIEEPLLQLMQQEVRQLRQQELLRLQLQDPDGEPWPQPGHQQQVPPVGQQQPAAAAGGMAAAVHPQGGPHVAGAAG
jgi:hypothetical protein